MNLHGVMCIPSSASMWQYHSSKSYKTHWGTVTVARKIYVSSIWQKTKVYKIFIYSFTFYSFIYLFIYFTLHSAVSRLIMKRRGPIRLQSRTLLRFKLDILHILNSLIIFCNDTFTILLCALSMVDTDYFRFCFRVCVYLLQASTDDILAHRRDICKGCSTYIIFWT